MFPKHRRAGFTLVELLTAIAIIGILSTLMFPVISGVFSDANSAKSVANLKEIGKVAATYSADNNFKALPARDEVDINHNGMESWLDILAFYITGRTGKPIYYTKSFSDPTWRQGGDPNYNPKGIGIALNIYPGLPKNKKRNDAERGAGKHYSLSSISSHPLRMLATQWNKPLISYTSNFRGELDKIKFDRNQNGGINVLFFDGHVDMINDYNLLKKTINDPDRILRDKM